jgi:hypothetical protein
MVRCLLYVVRGKTFTPPRHKDAKMNINQKVTRFALCLGAFVAICSGLFLVPLWQFVPACPG